VLCKKFRARTTLYRAGELLRQIFLTYRKNAYESPISHVREENGIIYLARMGGRIPKFRKDGLIYDFPDNLCSGEEQKQAILSWNGCDEALLLILELSDWMLEGTVVLAHCGECFTDEETGLAMSANIVLFETRVKQKVRDNCFLSFFDASKNKAVPEHEGTLHKALVVMLHTGETYALDVTGAQFGRYYAVAPWERYAAENVARIVKISPFNAQNTKLAREVFAMDDDQRALPEWLETLAKAFRKLFAAELGMKTQSAGFLLKGRSADFEEKKVDLAKKATRCTEEAVRQLEPTWPLLVRKVREEMMKDGQYGS